MKSVTDLQDEINSLYGKIKAGMLGHEIDQIIKEIKVKEGEIKEVRTMQLLKQVNDKQSRLRELAKLAFDAEQVTEDIFTNDGSFHKVKIKKYPKLAAIQYCHGGFKDGLMNVLKINGEKFELYKETGGYKEPKLYTRPATFEDFLSLNNILEKDITLEDYKVIREQLEMANKAFETAIKTYDQERERLKLGKLNIYGLIDQTARHEYKYTCK